MTTFIIVIATILLFISGLLIYGSYKIKRMRHRAFEEAVRNELLKMQRQVINDTAIFDQDPDQAKAIFDRRANRVICLFAEKFYGDSARVPAERSTSIQEFVEKLRKQLNNRVPIL